MPASEDDVPFDNDLVDQEAGYARTVSRGDAAGPLAATGDLAGARHALDGARDAYEAAQDALADAEGRVAVLEIKAAATEADEKLEEWQKAAIREDLAKAGRAFRRAGTVVERCEQLLDAAVAQLEAEEQALTARESGPPASGEDTAVQPRFATVELFVEMFVLPNWVHQYASRVRWCRLWWEHAEAITRLEALWEAFEVMRLQPAPSFSTWLRDHFDVHMRTLTDPEGVFYDCDAKEGMHKPNEPWKTQQAPTGMFAVLEAAQIQRSTRPPAAAVDGARDQVSGGSVVSEARSIKSTPPTGLGANRNSTRTTKSGVSR